MEKRNFMKKQIKQKINIKKTENNFEEHEEDEWEEEIIHDNT